MDKARQTRPAPCAAGVAALVLAAVAAAARHEPLARRLLDPEDRAGEDHPGLAADARRQGRLVHPVVRRVDRPGAGRRRRPEGRHRLPLDRRRRRTCSSTPASSTRTGTSSRYSGIAADTVVVFAVRNGNPKHIKSWDDLVKPGVQVITPNPFSSGSAKWNVLAAYGAQRRLGKTDKQAPRYVQKLFQHVVSQDTSGRNATNTFLSGKGDVLLTYESEAIAAQPARPGHPVRDPAPDDADRAPDRGAQEQREQGRRERVHPLHRRATPPRSCSRQYGFRPVDQDGREEVRGRSSRRGPGIFTIDDQIFGGWRDGRQGVVRPEQGPHGRRSSRRSEGRLWLAPPSHGRARRARATGREGGRPLARLRHDLPVADRRAADRGARLGVAGARRARASGRSVSRPEAVAALKLTLGAPRSSSRSSTPCSGRSPPGCSCATTSAARRSCNAVIDLPFALPTIVAGLTLLALYGPRSPIGDQRRVHAHGDRARAAVRDAAVRRPHGAAGAARARPRDGGGRALARRARAARLPPHRAAEHPPGDPLRRRARVRAGGRRDRRRSC